MGSASASRIALGLAQQASRQPNRLAVWDRDREFTFAELDALAGTLARQLVERLPAGTDHSRIVPVVTGRDAASVVALHAVLRAGCAAVPIDAGAPPEAVAALLARLDHPSVAVVSQAAHATRLPAGVAALAVPSDADDPVPPQPFDAEATALVLFTSGSTGEPKGVEYGRHELDGMFDTMIELGAEGRADCRSSVTSPFGFVAGVSRAYLPAAGPSLCVVDPTRMELAEILTAFDDNELDLVQLVPSLVRRATDRWPAGRRLERVRVLVTYGEPLEWSAVPALRAVLPPTAVIVAKYGASELLGETMRTVIAADVPLGHGRVPMGRPVGGYAAWLEPLADESDVAQVVMGGRCARGYWRDPALTAATFGTRADGTRFWRTGDVARVDADGAYHFIGRSDTVVKVRGMLADPSQPEAVLHRIPGVARAVVLAQAGLRGTRLVAHVELDPDAHLTPVDVRARLVSALAPQLVPQLLVRHEQLPLTDRHKVDRQALLAADPVPWRTGPPTRHGSTAERAVAEAAASVLGIDDVGPDDDLWELGLDSLAAAELLAALEDLGWPAHRPEVLLDLRTPAALARTRAGRALRPSVVTLNASGERPPVIAIPGALGDALTFRRLAEELGRDQPVVVVEATKATARERSPSNVEAAADRAVALVGDDVARRARVVVGYSAGGVVALAVAERIARRGGHPQVVLIDSPVTTGPGQADATASGWVLAAAVHVVPPTALPGRLRLPAMFAASARMVQRHRPAAATVPVTLVHARLGSGGADLVERWLSIAPDLEVLDLEADHASILGSPHVGVVAARIRRAVERG